MEIASNAPEFRGNYSPSYSKRQPVHPQHTLQLQRRVRGYGRFPFDNLVDGFLRSASSLREFGLRHDQRLDGVEKRFSGWDGVIGYKLICRVVSHGNPKFQNPLLQKNYSSIAHSIDASIL